MRNIYRSVVYRSIGMAAVWLVAAVHAQAQSPRLAAVSLVGSRIEVVLAQPGTGSHLDRNVRSTLEDAEGTLDRLVLQAVDRSVRKVEPAATLAMLGVPGSPLYDSPERLFDGRQLVLPGALVDAIVQSKASRLLVLTKIRDAPRLPLYQGFVGVGTVRGLGFYVDNDIRLQVIESRESATGVFAPFVYLKISLVDVGTGLLVREEAVRAMEAHATASNPKAMSAWDVMTSEQKVERLRHLIQTSVGEAVEKLLRPG